MDDADSHRVAVDAVYSAILDARRVAGDAAVCDALDRVGAGAGQGGYRHAAAAIRGLAPGRPEIDDDWALSRIMKFPPDRRREAVGIVAKDMARAPGAGKVKSITRRLHRKLENQKDEIVLSLPSMS
jgi:hypothetical protein